MSLQPRDLRFLVRPVWTMAITAGLAFATQGQTLSPDVRAAVEVAVNTATPQVQRIQALTPICAASSAERRAGLREIVERGDQYIAPVAAGVLLDEGWVDVVPIVSNRLLSWSDYGQSIVVSKIRFGPLAAGDALELPRLVLGHWRDTGTVPAPANGQRFTTAEHAALALSESGDIEDAALLEALIAIDAHRPGFWLARASLGALPAGMLPTASSIYSATSEPLLTRAAAAIAVSDQDQAAAALATQFLDQYLDQFEARDPAEVLAGGLTHDAAKVQDAKVFLNECIPLLPMLEHCPNQQLVEDVVNRCLASPNSTIRDLGATAAAIRAPAILLAAGRGTFTEGEYARLLGVAVSVNPTQDASARSAVGAAALDAVLQAAQTGGVRRLFAPAPATYYY